MGTTQGPGGDGAIPLLVNGGLSVHSAATL